MWSIIPLKHAANAAASMNDKNSDARDLFPALDLHAGARLHYPVSLNS
jgi:hypothetical protein